MSDKKQEDTAAIERLEVEAAYNRAIELGQDTV